ncbi:hypothetical protein ITJ43_12900 [Microbacterium sp. VKM Ac-2870]|uniref:hypothetical protein n=1 Tax=Microbacterium sp. VKM Ac-2870 TaxID=2783825 RepID=UPI00188AEFA9|nr:hypothetical protein [Microbacterium sp. VKM Ac-2870]MBF4563030.1 hypothetical protein [Microbacterium sp. VKM Ac-2870]
MHALVETGLRDSLWPAWDSVVTRLRAARRRIAAAYADEAAILAEAVDLVVLRDHPPATVRFVAAPPERAEGHPPF